MMGGLLAPPPGYYFTGACKYCGFSTCNHTNDYSTYVIARIPSQRNKARSIFKVPIPTISKIKLPLVDVKSSRKLSSGYQKITIHHGLYNGPLN